MRPRLRPLRPELRADRPLGLDQAAADTDGRPRTYCESACCCTPLLYSADACTCDSGCACTGSCIPSVPVGVTAQTDLVTLVSLGVLAIIPVVQPESALQRFRHTRDSPPRPVPQQDAPLLDSGYVSGAPACKGAASPARRFGRRSSIVFWAVLDMSSGDTVAVLRCCTPRCARGCSRLSGLGGLGCLGGAA